VRATAEERSDVLPGDEHLADEPVVMTHATTIRVLPARVWPWVAQMGAGRAGWYSHDRIDHGGVPSAEHVFPELGRLEVGDIVPGLPGRTDLFVVLDVRPDHHLVLGAPGRSGHTAATWTVVLRDAGGATRVIVRMRVGPVRLGPVPVPPLLVRSGLGAGHLVMQHRQFAGLRRRAERPVEETTADRPVVTARLLRGRLDDGPTELVADGTSMEPTIPRGSTVTVRRQARLRPGQIGVHVDRRGEVVVHRYRWRTPRGESFRGDGNTHNDPPVTTDHVVGRVTAARTPAGGRLRFGAVDQITGLVRLLAIAVRSRRPGRRPPSAGTRPGPPGRRRR
jgi:hypothetical protein